MSRMVTPIKAMPIPSVALRILNKVTVTAIWVWAWSSKDFGLFLRWYEREMPRQAGHDKGVRLLGGNSQGLTVTRVSACSNLPFLLKRISPTKSIYFPSQPLIFRPRCVLPERAVEWNESLWTREGSHRGRDLLKKLPFPGSVLYITPRKSYFHIP